MCSTVCLGFFCLDLFFLFYFSIEQIFKPLSLIDFLMPYIYTTPPNPAAKEHYLICIAKHSELRRSYKEVCLYSFNLPPKADTPLYNL